MTPTRKLHELPGTIKYCLPGQVSSPPYKNQPFFFLEIQVKSAFTGPRSESIYAFSNLVSPEVWKILEQQSFTGKKYLFKCEKRVRGWRLRGMEEIS